MCAENSVSGCLEFFSNIVVPGSTGKTNGSSPTMNRVVGGHRPLSTPVDTVDCMSEVQATTRDAVLNFQLGFYFGFPKPLFDSDPGCPVQISHAKTRARS